MSTDLVSVDHEAAESGAAVVRGPSWQLFPHGLLVFGRDLGPDGPVRLLVSSLELCTHPACTCREITLKAVELELTAPPESYEEFRRLLDGGQPKFFQIDIDLGLVDRIHGEDPRPPLDREWLPFLNAHVDGELLDRLHEHWMRAKGLKEGRGWRSIDWSTRDPHQMVVWEEMFPDDRVDHFLLADRVFFVDEHYCRRPGCSCNEVRLGFTEIELGGKYRDVGSVLISLPDGTLREREASHHRAPIVDALWAAYQKRHRVAARLAERNRRIQLIAPTLPTTRSASPPVPRTGRNDPCPCGSGKKFKRCCGA